MVWFGVVRDGDAIVEWQRQVAGSRRAPAGGRLGRRVSRTLGLPVVAAGAALLAMLPQVSVGPDLASPQTEDGQVLALGPVAYELGGLSDDAVRGPRDEGHRLLPGLTQDQREGWDVTGIDPTAASADVGGLLGADAADATGPWGPAGTAGASGIPATVLTAYEDAADTMARVQPSCHLPWWLLAGIGRIESGHASGGRVTADGTTRGRILGPRLDGSWAGTSVILDSDHGTLDGDPSYDRAVGPMQFLPGTWRTWGRDGNGDGVADPNNVFDAALAAGAYLCAGGRDLSTDAGIASAVLSYNYSQSYLQSVVTWGRAYRDGVTPTQDGSGDVPAPAPAPSSPPGPTGPTGTTGPTSPTSPSSGRSTRPPTSSTSSTTSTSTTTTPPATSTSSTSTTSTTGTTTTPPPTTTTGPSCLTDPSTTATTTTTSTTTSTTTTSTTSTSTGTTTTTGTPTGTVTCPSDPTGIATGTTSTSTSTGSSAP